MDNEVVVRMDEVSVSYIVPMERIGTYKEFIIRTLQRRVRHQEIIALKNVNVQVSRGEVFGIIGKNGAGKSTLLKVVAQVIRPMTGRVWVSGHVAPLLELGAGFHPELTGRENVFLNGALLGFTRREIEEKFDRIVDFAELWDFIDVPLRTYSTGMVARLGFSIATDTKFDILIVDELLSVGDEVFQRKSSARIDKFRERGATILLVTHNMEIVQKICQRAIWLDNGAVKAHGASGEVVEKYLASIHEEQTGPMSQNNIETMS